MTTIAVDLDGTLAEYDEFISERHIGKPIPIMVDRVRQYLNDGHRVIIFTARAASNDPSTILAIKEWCIEHIGVPLDITCRKTPDLEFILDDKAVTVERNTGRIKAVPCA